METKNYPAIGETLFSATLPNGLQVLVVPKSGFSSYYAVFAANYGGAHRRFSLDGRQIDTPAGVAHYLEHKMFDLPNGDNALNILSANGADPNAFTSSGITCYYFQCTEHFEENLRLLLHFVSTPYFTEETVQKERGIIGQEIRMGEDDPGSAIYYNLLELLYAHHPIRDKVAGTEESIAQITAQTLYDCHKAFYAPSNMCLVVEGDVDPQRICEIAAGELPEGRAEAPKADFGPSEGPLPVGTVKRQAMAVSAPQFYIGAKIAPVCGEGALRQRLVAQLALRMLAGRSSPFYTRLYDSGLLSRDFDYEVDFSAGTGTVILGGESSDPMGVLEELNKEVARIAEQGLDERRFELAKRASLGARLRGLEDFDNVCVSLASGYFDGCCSFDAPELLNRIQPGECQKFIAETLAPQCLAVSIIEPKGN